MLQRILESLPFLFAEFVAPEQQGSQRNVGKRLQAAVAAELSEAIELLSRASASA